MLRSIASRSLLRTVNNNRRCSTPDHHQLLFCSEKQRLQVCSNSKTLLNFSSSYYHHSSLVLPLNLSSYHHQQQSLMSYSTSIVSNRNIINNDICLRPTAELTVIEECRDDEFEDKYNKIISLFISYDNGGCSVPLQAILDCNDNYWDMLLSSDFLERLIKDLSQGFNNADNHLLWEYIQWLFSRDDFKVTQSMLSYIINVFNMFWEYEKECWDVLWQFVKRIGGKETGLITQIILYDLIEAYRCFPDDHIPIEILDKHEEFGCVPDYATYYFARQGISNLDVLLDYFKRVFSTDDTAKFTESMVSDIIKIFLELWGSNSDLQPVHLLWDFVKRIGGSGSGVVTTEMLNDLLFTFVVQGDTATATEILDRFEEFGCVPNLESYYYLADNGRKYTYETWDFRVCSRIVDILRDSDERVGKFICMYNHKHKPELGYAIYNAVKERASPLDVYHLIFNLSKHDKTLGLATDMLADLSCEARKNASALISLGRIGDEEAANKLIVVFNKRSHKSNFFHPDLVLH